MNLKTSSLSYTSPKAKKSKKLNFCTLRAMKARRGTRVNTPLSQINPVQAPTLLKIHFNIILQPI